MTTANPAVLFEDQGLLALDKPAGLLSHGDPGIPSALDWAQQREAKNGRDPERLHLVHRLDKETSGVLLLARGELAEAINLQFRERKVLKVYLALTSPVPPLRWMRVEQRLEPRRQGSGERMVVVSDGGVEADSEIEVLSRGRRLGLVRVIPEQGRKHQVRVALASSGAPIAGDFLYGGNLSKQLAKRVMLHARTLELRHPTTHEHMVFRAPLPKDFKQAIHEDSGSIPNDLDVRHRVQAQHKGPSVPSVLQADKAQALARAMPLPRNGAPRPGRKPHNT